jgi:hypothetical protein
MINIQEVKDYNSVLDIVLEKLSISNLGDDNERKIIIINSNMVKKIIPIIDKINSTNMDGINESTNPEIFSRFKNIEKLISESKEKTMYIICKILDDTYENSINRIFSIDEL